MRALEFVLKKTMRRWMKHSFLAVLLVAALLNADGRADEVTATPRLLRNDEGRQLQPENAVGLFDTVTCCVETGGGKTYDTQDNMLGLVWRINRWFGALWGVRVFSPGRSCLDLCDCGPFGTCSEIITSASDDETSYTCTCDEGFEFDGITCVASIPSDIFCGGIAAIPCPDGYRCVDDPGDLCELPYVGADCGGLCVPICGGIAGIPCPDEGLQCAWYPPNEDDGCQADCLGVCVPRARPFHPFCQGDENLPCKSGYTCIEDPLDDCGVGLSRGCIGYCQHACRGPLELDCPRGLVCIDDPNDTCENVGAAEDCPGLCVEPSDPPIPEGKLCFDDPDDDCNPDDGDENCERICLTTCGGDADNTQCPKGTQCTELPGNAPWDATYVCVSRVEPAHPFCQGDANIQCKLGYTCIDDPLDDCGPGLERSCIGQCQPACLGIAGLQCPDGLDCIDDPNDNCDPDGGGSDCLGICVPFVCNSQTGTQCPPELECEPHPSCRGCNGICVAPPSPIFCDSSGPDAQCPEGTQCVELPGNAPWDTTSVCVSRAKPTHPFCQGDADVPCQYGYTCIRDLHDDCAPDLERSCIGQCQPACLGFTGLQCPDELDCIDDPNDDCDPDNSGADCLGLCVPFECNSQTGIQCPPELECYPHPECDGCNGICVAPSAPIICNSQMGIQCPAGLECQPHSMCLACDGICVENGSPACNGQMGIECPPELECQPHPFCEACNGVCV